MPAELDEVSRRIMQLEIEREALRKETEAASQERLVKLERELADLKEQRTQLQSHWEQEKAAIQAASTIKKEIEQVRVQIEQAQREGDYGRASELQYGRLPELERQRAAEAGAPGHAPAGPEDAEGGSGRGRHRRGREQVDAHPAEPPHGGRGPEAGAHGGAPAPPRGRPGRGHPGRGQRHPPGACRPAGPEPAARQLHLPGPDRRRQDGTRARARRSSCSTTSRRWCASTCRSTRRSTPCHG